MFTKVCIFIIVKPILTIFQNKIMFFFVKIIAFKTILRRFMTHDRPE